MNKLLACALFSVIGLGLAVQEAAAWGCHPCCLRCRCRMIVTASQYNAFSPFCVDSVRYRGGCCGGFMFPQNNDCCAPAGCEAPYGSGVTGSATGQLPAAGAMPSAPAGARPAAPPAFTPPMPTPAGNTMAPNAQGWPQVYPAAMQPNYYPGYYPAYGAMGNQMPQMPGY